MNHIDRLVNVISGRRVHIQTHNFPDPDALGSAFGLQYLLEIKGIKADICYDGVIDKISTINMINHFGIEVVYYKDITDPSEDDVIIVVDAQAYNSNITDIIGNEIACIDHHPVVKEQKYEYSDLRITGACASIIAQYMVEADIEPESMVASALLFGIKCDTSNFQRGVTELDAEMYFRLFQCADHFILSKLSINQIEFADLKAYAAAINDITLHGSIGFAEIGFACSDALVALISDFLLALDAVEISIVYSVRKNGLKFSVRTENPSIDSGVLVCDALKNIGTGGGHAIMAGGFVPISSYPVLGENRRDTLEMRFCNAVMNGSHLL